MEQFNTLVIVDFQKDFYDKENGSLYVNGAENCVEPICNKIRNGGFDRVILTLDWHRFEDKSFKENGGDWPIHCLQFSEGASIHPDILRTIGETGIECEFFLKGDSPEHEEYGAFERQEKMVRSVNFKLLDFLCNYSNTSSVRVADKNTQTPFFEICGLAGDYCVWETYHNLMEHGYCVSFFKEGTAFIGKPFDYFEEIFS